MHLLLISVRLAACFDSNANYLIFTKCVKRKVYATDNIFVTNLTILHFIFQLKGNTKERDIKVES